uniref:Sodium/potassium/calcium exchanger 1-like n=1 Tax=Phallusia mammillata TaxID=59560 RepID=A0A6F9DRU2_9ASCI|nr:sodium/potassium/calcium exchanger 1-like [Phallusia mammillata]
MTSSGMMLQTRRRPQKRMKNISWGIAVILVVILGTLLYSNKFKDEQSSNVLERIRRNADNLTAQKNQTENETLRDQPIYPPDLFDIEARRKGAVILHTLGMLYMFVALAIVCDEFFVPALEVIIRRLEISDDVAGATFMAAGGSAPELATSLIGLFLAKSNVGIGTIVGSAVFNILFVIGMCSLFSREVLRLTWWPLFRDCMFYVISLAGLIIAFRDAKIEYYESIILLTIYLLYVTFMKFNSQIESWVKSKLPVVSSSSRGKNEAPRSVKAIVDAISNPTDTRGKSTFSYGIVQLMMHSLDPATDEDTADKSSRLYAIARMKLVSPRMAKTLTRNESELASFLTKPSTSKRGESDRPDAGRGVEEQTPPNGKNTAIVFKNEGTKVVPHTGTGDDIMVSSPSTSHKGDNMYSSDNKVGDVSFAGRNNGVGDSQKSNNEWVGNGRKSSVLSTQDLPEQHSEMLDLSWPKTCTKRCIYVTIAPIMFCLWLTLPDVRNPKKEGRFIITFIMSILWISTFSYFMVWMAHQVGETIGLSESEMGLTFLAAGTSVPDLITSVIVARKGLGDMAVSSSVGSNIFDVTVGLPFPWLLGSIISLGEPVNVTSTGLFCSILLLFSMLLFVIISIIVCKWQMSRKLGVVMLILYVVFLVLSLLLELGTIGCHLST